MGWLLTGKAVGAVLSIAYLAVATRSLGIAGFGAFTLVLSTAQAVGAFVGFQTWQIVVRYGVAHREAARPDALRRLVRFCVSLDAGGATAGVAVASVALWLMRAHFGWSESFAWQAVAFSAVLLLSIRSTAVGILRLHDRFAVGAAADAVTPVARCIGGGLAAWQQATVTGFLLAWAAAEVLTAAAYWISAARTLPGPWDKQRGFARASDDNPGLWHFALVTNMNATLTAAGRQFVVILVGLLTGVAAAGQYRLAYQVSQALVRLSDMFARAVLPEMARAHAGSAEDGFVRLVRQSTRLAVVVGAACCILAVLLGKPALLLIAGESYLGAYPVLALLGAAAGLEIMAAGFEPALLGTGRAGQAFRIRATSTLVLLGAVALLMPGYGAMGAGLASVAASALALALFAHATTRLARRPM